MILNFKIVLEQRIIIIKCSRNDNSQFNFCIFVIWNISNNLSLVILDGAEKISWIAFQAESLSSFVPFRTQNNSFCMISQLLGNRIAFRCALLWIFSVALQGIISKLLKNKFENYYWCWEWSDLLVSCGASL